MEEVFDIVQETGINTIPMEKKCKKAKLLSREALQIAVKRREVTDRFKGLDLLECLKNYGQRFVTGGSNHDHPQEKEIQKSKTVV